MAAGSDLGARVASAAVLLPVFVAAVVWLPTGGLALVFAAVVLLGAWEWSAIALGPGARVRRMAFVLATAALLAMAWLAARAQGGTDGAGMLRGAGVWWAVAGVCLVAVQLGRALEFFDHVLVRVALGWLVLVPGWLSLVLLHERAIAALLTVFALVWAADIGAYFAGRRIGGPKLAPRISPGKTWSGFGGGLVAALTLALLVAAHVAPDMSLALFLAIVLVTVVASVVGDLFESHMKRRAGLKDSGALIPGHGGVLDRIDSLTAAGPVFALALARGVG